MRTFRFPLQPALDAALAREREAGIDAARAKAHLDSIREVVALLDVRTSEARMLARARSVGAWIAADWYAGRLRDVRAKRADEHSAAAERAARSRDVFERRRSEARVLDVLRARRLAEHRARSAMLDAAEIEESNEAARAGFLKGTP